MVLPAAAAVAADPRIRVLVVDHSAVTRRLITQVLQADPEIEVVASAPNGRVAVAAASRLPVDVAVLDIDMPTTDRLTAIPLLLKAAPGLKIVLASIHAAKDAQVTVEALAAGAVDYILKPSAMREVLDSTSFNRELLGKVKQLGVKRHAISSTAAVTVARQKLCAVPDRLTLRSASNFTADILVIGSSTGGPEALLQMLKELPPDIRVPMLIVQHMPATFTGILAANITRLCGIAAAEAADGDRLEPGRVYVAPGNFHMTVDTARVIRINQDPPENYCRPSVDPTLRSIATVYGGKVLAVILTGMGSDGLKGCQAVVDAGGTVIAQDEATSVVWGMPGAVAMAGLCSAVLPLTEIGPRLQPYLKGRP